MPTASHTGARNSEKAVRAPEEDNSSIAIISPIREGKTENEHFSPFIPPSIKAPHTLTRRKSPQSKISIINIGMKYDIGYPKTVSLEQILAEIVPARNAARVVIIVGSKISDGEAEPI